MSTELNGKAEPRFVRDLRHQAKTEVEKFLTDLVSYHQAKIQIVALESKIAGLENDLSSHQDELEGIQSEQSKLQQALEEVGKSLGRQVVANDTDIENSSRATRRAITGIQRQITQARQDIEALRQHCPQPIAPIGLEVLASD
jgi:chromosome segregation ATPase